MQDGVGTGGRNTVGRTVVAAAGGRRPVACRGSKWDFLLSRLLQPMGKGISLLHPLDVSDLQ